MLSRQTSLNSGVPEENKTTLSSQYGSIQLEYVVLPDALLAKTQELKRFFYVSFEHVKSLKPKPTTRKKKTESPKKAKV